MESYVADIPDSTVRYIQSLIPEVESFGGETTTDQLAYLTRSFSINDQIPVDYELFAGAFTYKYFFKNLLKAYFCFRASQSFSAQKILDIGSGSGATSIGYLLARNEYFEQFNRQSSAEIELIDQSSRQHEIAARLLAVITPQLSHLNIQTMHSRQEFDKHQSNEAEMIIGGHILPDTKHNTQFFITKLYDSLLPGGTIILIDRINEAGLLLIEEECQKKCLQYTDAEVRVSVNQNMPGVEQILQTKFLKITKPEHIITQTLLMKYFDAWRQQSTELIREIFSTDALYQEKPFEEGISGLENIVKYWEENPLNQQQLSIRIRRAFYYDTVANAEWLASFSRGNQNIDVHGILSLYIDIQTRKIGRLEEVFRTRKSKI